MSAVSAPARPLCTRVAGAAVGLLMVAGLGACRPEGSPKMLPTASETTRAFRSMTGSASSCVAKSSYELSCTSRETGRMSSFGKVAKGSTTGYYDFNDGKGRKIRVRAERRGRYHITWSKKTSSWNGTSSTYSGGFWP